MGFDPVTNCQLAARITVAMPVSGPAVPLRNTLGAAGRMVRWKLSLTPPGVRNNRVASPSTLKGSWALTWLGDKNSIGESTPFTVRQDSPRAVGKGTSLVA